MSAAVNLAARNPESVYRPYANYAHAVEVPAGWRTLFVSGINGFDDDGSSMPDSFGDQARQVWRHLARILADADMTHADLVSLRIYLADPSDDEENVRILGDHLRDHLVARTVISCQLLEPTWRIEIEAVAAAPSLANRSSRSSRDS